MTRTARQLPGILLVLVGFYLMIAGVMTGGPDAVSGFVFGIPAATAGGLILRRS